MHQIWQIRAAEAISSGGGHGNMGGVVTEW